MRMTTQLEVVESVVADVTVSMMNLEPIAITADNADAITCVHMRASSPQMQ